MSLIDGLFKFAKQQAIAADATGGVLSTNVHDAGAAKLLFDGASGQFNIAIQATAAGGTTPTIKAELIGADSENMATNPIVLGTVQSPVLSALPWIAELKPRLQTTKKRYYAIKWTASNADNTFTLNAVASLQHQSRMVP